MNVNFLMLVPLASASPVVLTATHVGANIQVAFQSTSGFSYQMQFKNSLTDASWTPLGGLITGDGTIKSVLDPASGSSRFYRVNIQ